MITLLIALFVHGAPAKSAANSQIVDTWSVRDGLPQNSVMGLLQHTDGSIWITTSGGIARFDGRDFRRFTPTNTPELTSLRFRGIAADGDGVLWFSTEKNEIYAYRDEAFRRYSPPVVVKRLTTDRDGQVWGASRKGLVRISWSSIEIIEGADISTVILLNDGRVVGLGNGERRQCVDGCQGLPPMPKNPDNYYSTWWTSPEGVHYVARSGELLRYDGERWTVEHPLEVADQFPGKFVDWNNDHYLLNAQSLINIESGARIDLNGHVPTTSTSTPFRVATPDSEGGLWLGHGSAGLMRLQPRQVQIFGNGDPARTVAATSDGDVWFGWCGPLRSMSGETDPFWPPLWCGLLWSDGAGTTYITGTERSDQVQLYRVEPNGSKTAIWEFPNPSELRESVPVGPFFMNGPTIYYLPEGQPPVEHTTAAALGGKATRLIAWAGGQEVWIELDGVRLLKVSPAGIIDEIDVSRISDVRDVFEGPNNTWLASYGSGLAVVENGAATRTLTPESGLCDSAISRIFPLEDGSTWLQTNRGLGRVASAELDQWLEDPTMDVACELVDSGEANGTAGIVLDGRLLVATLEGLSVLDPAAVLERRKPVVTIESMLYEGQPVGSEFWGPGSLAVRFGAIEYRAPLGLRYRYRFGGTSSTWSQPSQARDLVFDTVPPGAQTFEVQAKGAAGAWGPVARKAFQRRALWWERLDLQIGLSTVVLLIGAAGLFLLWWREKRRNLFLRKEVGERARAEVALRHEQEQRAQAQSALASSERLQALGRLSGGIAHDFNNLLAAISGHAWLLSQTQDPQVHADATAICEAVDRGTDLTAQLLVLGRPDDEHEPWANLADEVEALMPMLRRLIQRRIALKSLIHDRPIIGLDRGQLGQVITNLVLNSRDAIEGKGHIEIVVRLEGGTAVLRVSDDGSGMSDTEKAQVFEPYFTTKAAGEGTGLGLSTVHSIVTAAQGEVTLKSAPHQGTTVEVRFGTTQPNRSDRPMVLTPAPLRSLRFLIVDDQPEVGVALCRLVEADGGVAVTVQSKAAALKALDNSAFDVVLMDTVMPIESGPEVAAALRQQHPDLAIVFISGHVGEYADAIAHEMFLAKPVKLHKLRHVVAQLQSTQV